MKLMLLLTAALTFAAPTLSRANTNFALYHVPASKDGAVAASDFPVSLLLIGKAPNGRDQIVFGLPEDLAGSRGKLVVMTATGKTNEFGQQLMSGLGVDAACERSDVTETTSCRLNMNPKYLAIDDLSVRTFLIEKYADDFFSLNRALSVSSRFTRDPEGALIFRNYNLSLQP